MTRAFGVDVGGTGIKAGIVDTATGELQSERVKLQTPAGARPDDVIAAILTLRAQLPGAETLPTGVCVPAIVHDGVTRSAANISEEWVDYPAAERFSAALGHEVAVLNDADAAGEAELSSGAAHGLGGLTILTTLGTGIGSALIYDGILVPNSELGHLEIGGVLAESTASYAAKKRDGLDWAEWAQRLDSYYGHLELYFSPQRFIVGGGVSKYHEDFLPLLTLTTPIVPARHRNLAGIIGAASAVVHRDAR